MRKRWPARQGQTLVIVALSIIVLMGMVALAIDGGSALLQRRNMQNAADAGALGAMRLMEGNVAVTCTPAPCHPTYVDMTNQSLHDRVVQLATANRGGTLGAAGYADPLIEYHLMSGGQACSSPGYVLATNYPANFPPPPCTDGVRVTTAMTNPTTFGRVINILSIPVGARAAARLYGTCPPQTAPAPTLPMVRFRPPVEDQLAQYGNDRCHPFTLWTPSQDVGGSGFANVLSFDTQSFEGTGPMQLLNTFDGRNGPPPPPDNIDHSGLQSYGVSQTCSQLNVDACADMRGKHSRNATDAQTSVQNWIYWQWQGRISLTDNWPVTTETWYPANRTNNGGQIGASSPRQGDWAETFTQGVWGQNVQQPLHDLAANFGVDSPVSPPRDPQHPAGLNWGKVITKTLFLWGPQSIPIGSSVDNVGQTYLTAGRIPNCSPPGDPRCQYTGWEDLIVKHDLRASCGGYCASNAYDNNTNTTVNRVLFTYSYQVRIYANLQGNYNPSPPAECASSWAWSPTGSTAYGLIINTVVPGPGGGTCGWVTGGGVYGRGVDPNEP